MSTPVALITGVGDGTGAALARRFAEGGYHVAMLARDLGPKGVHVAYVTIDAVIDTPWTRVPFHLGKPAVGVLATVMGEGAAVDGPVMAPIGRVEAGDVTEAQVDCPRHVSEARPRVLERAAEPSTPVTANPSLARNQTLLPAPPSARPASGTIRVFSLHQRVLRWTPFSR